MLAPGFYPFWFWNDTLAADEIRWQVAQMAAQGVRGFFIHSRQGLGQPYLSDAFFEMVDAALAAAHAHGMVVHLYDEYPYPSGVAGGEVVLGAPQYRATALIPRTYELAGGDVRVELPRGLVLSCMAYPLVDGAPDWKRGFDLRSAVGMHLALESYNEMGLTRYNRKRYFASEPVPVLATTLPAGPHRLYVAVQAEVTGHKYWDRYVDVLNPAAVRRFIALTHERYAARYSDEFACDAVRGAMVSIFADETAPGWSDCLPAIFEAETGYDLLSALPALMEPAHPDHARVAHDFGMVRYRRFCASWEAQLSGWCQDHGIAYSGEKPSVRLAQLRYMDIPGCEPGHTKAGAQPDWLQARLRSNAKATADAAYFYGKSGALCECYHSTGWSATLQDAKAIADGLLLAGIRYLVPHGFFYTTHALKKHDAPPTFFFQMPFWPFFGALSDYLERVFVAFEGTHIGAEVLLVDVGSGVPLHEDRSAYPYLAAYEALLWALMRAHLDYHIVDTDILEAGEIAGGRITVRDVTARVVVLPAMPVVEPALLAWLDRFEAAGGVVVRAGVVAGAGDAEGAASAAADAVAQVSAHVGPSLSASVDGVEAGDLLLVKRSGAGRALWFGFNAGARTLEVAFVGPAGLREVALDPALPPALRFEEGSYRRTVAPFASFLLEAAPEARLAPPSPVISAPVAGPAGVRPLNANLLRLGAWRMALRQPDGGYGQEAEVEAMPLVNQLAQSALPFAPAFRTYFGHRPDISLPELTVRYTAVFENAYDGAVALVMEPGSLVGAWRIAVNGTPPLTAADFAPADAHVRGSLGADITDRLLAGANTITVELTTDRLDGGLLNCLYLAGGFGVALAPLGLVAPVSEGRFEDYVGNGLPFYAGTVTYTTAFDLPALPDADRVILALDSGEYPCHEAMEVAVNGGEFIPVLWEPRQIVVPTDQLCAGTNTLHIRVHTTLIRAFEGQWFDHTAHRYRDVGDEPGRS